MAAADPREYAARDGGGKVNAEEFFRLLYGDEPTGWLVISHALAGGKGLQSKSFDVTRGFEEPARFCEAQAESGNIYFGIGLRSSCPADGKRGSSAEVGSIPGFWLDADFKGPAHQKQSLPEGFDDLEKLLAKFPFPPSLVVDTGHGAHPYWLFKEPWTFDTPEERERAAALMKRFQATFRAHAKTLGWDHTDSTHDLARVLRPPGTFNVKNAANPFKKGEAEPLPVAAVLVRDHHEGRRYNPADFEEFMVVEEEPKAKAKSKAMTEAKGDTNHDDVIETLRARLPSDNELLQIARRAKNGKKFKRLFDDGSIEGYPSGSEADMALLLILCFYCGPDPERVEKLFSASALARREKVNGDCSWDRADYRERSIGKAIALTLGENGEGAYYGKRVDASHDAEPADPRDRILWLLDIMLTPEEEAPAILSDDNDAPKVIDKKQAQRLLVNEISSERGWEICRRLLGDAREKLTGARARLLAALSDDVRGWTAVLADTITVPEVGDTFALDPVRLIHVYERGVYKTHGAELVMRRARELLERWSQVKEWATGVGRETAAFIETRTVDLWPRPPLDRINILNGIIDTTTGKLGPHERDFLSTVQLPITYNPKATCPRWDAFIEQTFPEDAVAAGVAWEICAWLMIPLNLQRALMLLGQGGNGKSRFLEAIKSFVGRVNISGQTLQSLETNRFAVASLAGRLVNVCADLPTEAMATTSAFKALTGGDSCLILERKYKNATEFAPFARLCFSCNEPPIVEDTTHGFFRRWICLPFERTFEGKAGHRHENEIDAELAAPGELAGVLNKALEALPRVMRDGITITQAMAAATDEFRAKTSPIASWLDDNIAFAPDSIVPRGDVMRRYNGYAIVTGKTLVTSTSWGTAFAAWNPKIECKQRTIDGKLFWCYVGIELANEPAAHGREEVPHWSDRG